MVDLSARFLKGPRILLRKNQNLGGMVVRKSGSFLLKIKRVRKLRMLLTKLREFRKTPKEKKFIRIFAKSFLLSIAFGSLSHPLKVFALEDLPKDLPTVQPSLSKKTWAEWFFRMKLIILKERFNTLQLLIPTVLGLGAGYLLTFLIRSLNIIIEDQDRILDVLRRNRNKNFDIN